MHVHIQDHLIFTLKMSFICLNDTKSEPLKEQKLKKNITNRNKTCHPCTTLISLPVFSHKIYHLREREFPTLVPIFFT